MLKEYENTLGKVYINKNFVYMLTAVSKTVIEIYDESDTKHISSIFNDFKRQMIELEKQYIMGNNY